MNVPGFNMRAPQSAAPFQLLPPEVLAQMAAASFRPPGPAPGAGLPGGGMGMPGGGDGGLGAGMGLLGAGLGAVGKMGGLGGGAPGAGAMPGEDRATAPQWPPPMGDTTTTVQPTNGGFFDFLTGWLRR